jgi:hypothetical protein
MSGGVTRGYTFCEVAGRRKSDENDDGNRPAAAVPGSVWPLWRGMLPQWPVHCSFSNPFSLSCATRCFLTSALVGPRSKETQLAPVISIGINTACTSPNVCSTTPLQGQYVSALTRSNTPTMLMTFGDIRGRPNLLILQSTRLTHTHA